MPSARKTATPEQALVFDETAEITDAALRLLARREHSRYELTRKLAARFGGSSLVDEVLDELGGRGIVDDDRFAEALIDQRTRKGFGPVRIRADLREKGMDANRIERHLQGAAIDWSERLHDVAERKFGAAVAAGRNERMRRGRFLEQRGFPVDLIRRYLDQA